jgi:hypothetical protein
MEHQGISAVRRLIADVTSGAPRHGERTKLQALDKA